ncbi:MAG: SRPBCC domain-containing protein [Deltaproteobacteria bacterium]|nr:SRPBCC domain-containing protein [Deltaproteobacteria bacterium]
MSVTVRVQPVVLARDWRATLDWISRVFELPVTQSSDSSKFGELLISGEHVGVLGREVPDAGDASCALEIEVFDIEAALERARNNNAKVLSEPSTIGDAGRQASIKLPTGVVVWLWEPDEEQDSSEALGTGPLYFSVRRRIQATPERVFEAITKAGELEKYFVKSAKGDLKVGADVTWSWESDAVGLEVLRTVPNQTVEFVWEAYGVDYLTKVRFDVVPNGKMTRVTIVESGWHNDARGRQSAFDHAEGWTEFLLHLRLYIEKGLDVR